MKLSLQKRLIWILLALTLFAWVTSAMLTFFYASRVMLGQVDQQLEQYSDLASYITQVFARQVDRGVPVAEPWFDHQFEEKGRSPMVIQGPGGGDLSPALNVFLGGKLLALLENSPEFPPPAREGFEFRELEQDGSNWRTLARHDQLSGLWVLVGIDLDGARWSLLGILGRALLPLLIVLPLTVALLYFGVSRGLRPLKTLAEQIDRRSPGLLNPVEPDNVPEEVQGVVAALNDLLQRLALALEAEQRFTANAAHELLTPLAAIKTEVQLCQRQVEDESGRLMLERIAVRVNRATHTVEQLLTLARVDPESVLPMEVVDLRSLLTEVLAETGHLATRRNLELAIADGAAVEVDGVEEALAILLRNLLVNAFRYATEATTVQVRLDGGPLPAVVICNECRPLSEAEFDRLCDRFYRVPGSAGVGAGLGLSIVSRIAEQHGARLSLGPDASGQGF
jgi:signal transduction histidine kinase